MLKTFLLGATMLAMGTVSASAISLTLSAPLPTTADVGPQSASAPCIICATTQAHNPDFFGYNNFIENGNISNYNMYSTNPTDTVLDGVQGTPYSVLDVFRAGGGTKFDVALDVNTTGNGGETLTAFEVIVNGLVWQSLTGLPKLLTPINNNGNGFADYLIQTVDLSSFKATDSVLFHAIWTGAVDGGESFFLTDFDRDTTCIGCTPNPTVVPIPPAIALFGMGLVGLGIVTRRRRKTA